MSELDEPTQATGNVIGETVERHGSAREPLFAVLTSSRAVGQILLLDYDTATLAVHDYHKEMAGGLTRGMFLLAGDVPTGEDPNFVLLRVAGAPRLASQVAMDEAKLTAARDAIGTKLWSDTLTKWIADEVVLGGVQARILGTERRTQARRRGVTSGYGHGLRTVEEIDFVATPPQIEPLASAWANGGSTTRPVTADPHQTGVTE